MIASQQAIIDELVGKRTTPADAVDDMMAAYPEPITFPLDASLLAAVGTAIHAATLALLRFIAAWGQDRRVLRSIIAHQRRRRRR